MPIKFDPVLEEVIAFIDDHVPTFSRVPIVEALYALAPMLWGHADPRPEYTELRRPSFHREQPIPFRMSGGPRERDT